jgi:hypothetical protein
MFVFYHAYIDEFHKGGNNQSELYAKLVAQKEVVIKAALNVPDVKCKKVAALKKRFENYQKIISYL